MKLRHGILELHDNVATEIIVDDTDEVQYSASFIIQNIDNSAVVYLGDSTVTTSDFGYMLDPGQSFTIGDVPRYPGLYAVTDTNNSTIAVLRTSF
jgi:hypothetical protein